MELQGDQVEATFLNDKRKLVVKIPFAVPHQQDNEMDDMFRNFETEESEKIKGEKLLESNVKKIKEHQLELKSDLLTDIM